MLKWPLAVFTISFSVIVAASIYLISVSYYSGLPIIKWVIPSDVYNAVLLRIILTLVLSIFVATIVNLLIDLMMRGSVRYMRFSDMKLYNRLNKILIKRFDEEIGLVDAKLRACAQFENGDFGLSERRALARRKLQILEWKGTWRDKLEGMSFDDWYKKTLELVESLDEANERLNQIEIERKNLFKEFSNRNIFVKIVVYLYAFVRMYDFGKPKYFHLFIFVFAALPIFALPGTFNQAYALSYVVYLFSRYILYRNRYLLDFSPLLDFGSNDDLRFRQSETSSFVSLLIAIFSGASVLAGYFEASGWRNQAAFTTGPVLDLEVPVARFERVTVLATPNELRLVDIEGNLLRSAPVAHD